MQEGTEVALVAEPPDHARKACLELSLAEPRGPVDEIGDRIEAADCKPAVAIDHDQLGGRRPNGHGCCEPGGRNHQAEPEPLKLPLAPRCGHSLADHAAIRLRFGRKATVITCPTG